MVTRQVSLRDFYFNYMTMAWIEVHQELRNHPKIIRLAATIQCSKASAIGYLVSLWLWAVAYSRDGDLTTFSEDEICEACTYEGKNKKQFYESLIACKFLDKKEDKIVIHDWKKHGLRILEQSRKRMAKSRRNKDLQENVVTQQLRNGNALLSLFLSNHSNLSNQSILSNKEFLDVWERWFQFRREKKKPLTQTMADGQLTWLIKQKNPIEIIEQSIRNGWQGLFEIKQGQMNGTGTKQSAPDNKYEGVTKKS